MSLSHNAYHTQFRRDTGEVEAAQRAVLSRILPSLMQSHYASGCLNLAPNATPEQYTANVKLANYEDFRPFIDRMQKGENNVLSPERTVAFFKTSGSTSLPKLIPVTASFMREKVSAFATFWGQIYQDYPAVADGTVVSNFIDSGSAERSDGGVDICSESTFWSKRGRSINSLKRWPLPAELRQVKHLQARLYAVARLLLQGDLHCIMCLNPSTLLQFCRTLEQYTPELVHGLQNGTWGLQDITILKALDVEGKVPLHTYLQSHSEAAERLLQGVNDATPPSLKSIWPMLQLVVCWRSAIVQPYFVQLAPYLQSLPVRDYISQSSECIMAIPLVDGSSGGTLAYQSHFFEFIPEQNASQNHPNTLFAWQLEEGMRYELVVTTGGGLYRYRTGDCVRVNGYLDGTPLIEFLYRLGRTSSITGEKLTEYQVLDAASKASEELQFQPAEYLLYPCSGETPHYGVMVDVNKLHGEPADIQLRSLEWVALLDNKLRQANTEYGDKCASGRLGPMRCFQVDGYALVDARTARKAASVSDEQVKDEVLSNQLDRHKDIDSARLLRSVNDY